MMLKKMMSLLVVGCVMFLYSFGSFAEDCLYERVIDPENGVAKVHSICKGDDVYDAKQTDDYNVFVVVSVDSETNQMTIFRTVSDKIGSAAIRFVPEVFKASGCGINYCVGHLVQDREHKNIARVIAVNPISEGVLVRRSRELGLRYYHESDIELEYGFYLRHRFGH